MTPGASTTPLSRRTASSRRGPPVARPVPLAVVTMALVYSAVIPWRPDSYFEGQVDSVVIAKALTTLIAAVLALMAYGRGDRRTLPLAPVLLLSAYLLCTLIGALTDGKTLMPSAVIAVRVILVAAATALLVAAYGVEIVMASLVRVFEVVLVLAVVSGVSTISSGRLRGTLPPLNPNELAFTAAVCLIWTMGRVLRGQEHLLDVGVIVGLMGVIFLTGSRTTLLAVGLSAVLMLTRFERVSITAFALGLCALPVAAYVLLETDTLASVFGRGGSSNISTLANRTIAWESAFERPQNWHDTFFGSGLSVKKVEVPGQWWNTQIFDSSWVSALVQGGYVGLVLIGVWVLAALTAVLRSVHRWAAVWIGLCVCISFRSVLESGLFDASSAFLCFWLTSLATLGPPSVVCADYLPIQTRDAQPA